MTSPLVVPTGVLTVREDAPAPLLPGLAARSEIPPVGGGVGVAVGIGVGVEVGVAVGVLVGVGVAVGVDVDVPVTVGVGVAVGLAMVKESVKLLGAVEPIKLAEAVS